MRHIWGDTPSCSGTDYVADTPNQQNPTNGCLSFPHTDACTTVNPGIMFMNYMDYSFDDCMNIFTAGQVNRMLPLFDTQNGIRRDILTNAAYLTGLSCTNNFMNQTVTSNKTVTSCGDINVRNVIVKDHVKLTINAAGEVNISPNFKVALGSELEIK